MDNAVNKKDDVDYIESEQIKQHTIDKLNK